MTAYFDTSAAVKLIIAEPGSVAAVDVWQAADRVTSSVLLYPEARAALKRARRERRLTESDLRAAVADLGGLWHRVNRVGVSARLAMRAGALAHVHDLRGYDAVHLASAEVVAAPDLVFVGADDALCDAAGRIGLAVARVGR